MFTSFIEANDIWLKVFTRAYYCLTLSRCLFDIWLGQIGKVTVIDSNKQMQQNKKEEIRKQKKTSWWRRKLSQSKSKNRWAKEKVWKMKRQAGWIAVSFILWRCICPHQLVSLVPAYAIWSYATGYPGYRGRSIVKLTSCVGMSMSWWKCEANYTKKNSFTFSLAL